MSTSVLDRRSFLKSTGSLALAFSLAGIPAAQRRGDLGLEQATLVTREASGPRPNQGVVSLDRVFHRGSLA